MREWANHGIFLAMRTKYAIEVGVTILVLFAWYVFFTSVSPLNSEGTIDQKSVLLGSILLGAAIFSIFRLFVRFFVRPKFANLLSIAASFICVQGLLVSSLGSLSVVQHIALVLFNILVLLYVVIRLS